MPRCREFEMLAGCSRIHRILKDSWTLRLRGPRMQAFVHTQALWAPDGRGPQKSSKDWRMQKLQGLQTVVDFERATRIRGCKGLVGDSPFWTGRRKLTEATRASHGRGLETC